MFVFVSKPSHFTTHPCQSVTLFCPLPRCHWLASPQQLAASLVRPGGSRYMSRRTRPCPDEDMFWWFYMPHAFGETWLCSFVPTCTWLDDPDGVLLTVTTGAVHVVHMVPQQRHWRADGPTGWHLSVVRTCIWCDDFFLSFEGFFLPCFGLLAVIMFTSQYLLHSNNHIINLSNSFQRNLI